MTYLLDSNAIIDLLNSKNAIAEKIKRLPMTDRVSIPDIAYYEVLRGFFYQPAPEKQAKFENFCRLFGIEYQSQLSLRIAAQNYARLKKLGIAIEDDDLLIGALAVSIDAVLVTNNEKHLGRMRKYK